MAKGGKGKALKPAKGKKAKHDANTAAQQGTLEEQLEVAADSRQHLTATQQAVVGLSNVGNTCFFNSSVQLLLSCAPLQQMVLLKDHDITKGPLGYALQQASLHAAGNSSKSKAGGHSTYNPQSLLSAVCCHAPVFKGKQQHDAHELMRMLLDGLQSQELRYKDLSRRSVSKSKAAALPGTVHTNGLAQNGATDLSTTSSSSTSSRSTPLPAASTDAAPHSNGVLAQSTPSDASDDDAVSTASSVGDDAAGTAAAGDGLADLCQAYLAKRQTAATLDSLTDTSEAASEGGAAAADSIAAPSEASSTGADGGLSSTSSSCAGDSRPCSPPPLDPPAAAATGEPTGAEVQGSSARFLDILPAAQAPTTQDTDELPGLDPAATGVVDGTHQAAAPTQVPATATATANGTAAGCRVCGAVLQQQQQQGSAGGPLQRKSLLPPEPPKSAGSSSVEAVFGGVLSSVITCTACGYCSISYEPFLDLSLPIPLGAGRPGESIVRKGSLLSRLASRTGAKKKAAAQAASADTSTDGSNAAGTDAAAAAAAAAEAAATAAAAAAAAAAAQGKKLNHKEKRKLQLQASKAAKEASKLARLAKKKQQQQEDQQEPSGSSKGEGQPPPPAAAEAGATPGLFEDIPPTNYYLAEQTSLRESLVGRDLQQQQHEDAVSSLLVEQQQQQQQEASAVSANAASGAAADVEPAVQLSVCAGGSDEAGSSHSGWTDIGGGSSSPRTAAVGCWGGGWVEQPTQLAAAAPSSTSSSFVQPPPSSSSGFASSSSDAGGAAAGAAAAGSDGSSPKAAQQQPTTGRSTLHRRFGSLGNLSALTSGAKGGLTSLFTGRHSRQGSKDKDGLDKLAAAAVNGASGGSGQRPSSAGVTSPSTGRGGLKGFLSRATTPPPARPSSALGVVSEAGEAAGRSGVAGRSSIPEEYPVDDQLHRRGEQQHHPLPQEQPVPQGGGQAVLYTPLGVVGGLAVSAAGPEEQPATTAAAAGGGSGGGGGVEGGVQGTGSTGGVPLTGRRLQRAFSDDAVVRLGSFQRSSSSSSGGGGGSSGGAGEQQHAAAPAGVAGGAIEPNAAHALGSREQLPSPDKGVAAAAASAAVNDYASNPFAAPSVQLQPELGQEHPAQAPPQQQQQQQQAAGGAVVLPAEDPFAAAAVVAKGDALAMKHCLASFFVREDVLWECPKEKALWKERRVSAGSGGPAAAASSSGGGHSAAAAGTVQAAAGDGVCASCRQQQQQGGVAIAAHPRLQQLLEGNEEDDGPVFKQVSFSEREPQIHLVPGSVEQRGTDLSAALAGRRPFCRALSAAGASLLLTAQLGEVFLEGAAAGRELRLGLRAAGEGGVANAAAAEVLPGGRELQLGAVRLPDVQALSLSGEDSAALLQHWAQLLLNCMADLVACEGGLTGLQDMVRGSISLMPAGEQRAALRPGYLDADSLEGQWKVRGQLPGAARGQDKQQQQQQGYWEYPAGDAEEAEEAATAATADSREASPVAVGLSSAASPGSAAAATGSIRPAGSMQQQQQGLQPQGIAAAGARESQELGGCEDMFAMDEEGGGGAEQQEQGPCWQLTQGWQGDVLSSGSSSNLAGSRAARPGSSLGSRDGDDSSSSTGRGMSPFKKVPLSPSGPTAAHTSSSSSSTGGAGLADEAGLAVTAAEEAYGSLMPQVSSAASRPVDIVQPLQGSPPDSCSLTGRSPLVGSAGGTPGSLRRSSLRRRSSSCSRTAHKAYRIYLPPQVLLLHLKRFQHDGRGRLNKLDTAVAFDFELDLSPFMAANAPGAPTGSSSTAGSGSCGQQQQQQELMYDLVGLVVHMGTMRGGHYVAYVKRVHGAGEQQQDQPAAGSSTGGGRAQWYYVSDTSVRPVGVSEVAAAQAYMLLYVRRPAAQPPDAAEQGLDLQ